MKSRILLLALFFFCATGAITAQENQPREPVKDTSMRKEPAKDSAPYKQYPKLPAFNIRLLDSFTIFNTFNIPKGRPTAIVFFDPDCKHCRAMTKRLLQGMDSLQNIDFYWITPVHSNTMLRDFNSEYHLTDYKNIKVVGRDYEFFFGDFFDVHYVPDIAVYDENKMFLRLYEGGVKVKELHELTHKQE